MDEYEDLVKALESEVRSRQSMSWEELLKWGEERNVGPVTLSLLLEELKRRGVVEASPELELVDEHLEIAIPRRISLKRPRTPPPRPKPAREKRPRAARGRQGSLLTFLEGEEVSTGAIEGAKEVREAEEAETETAVGPPPVAAAEVEPPRAQEPVDRDLAVALQYLNRYWSVGRLRLLADLRSLGVKDPEGLLRRLIEEGMVTVVEPGVVNAKRDIVEKKVKELGSVPAKSLAELLEF
ncbi:MAG: hypothetical protein LM576_03765 [Thermofilum sp.]|jgi:hypothetical protein|nr:hypothetical protein [Thermofilum sp.]